MLNINFADAQIRSADLGYGSDRYLYQLSHNHLPLWLFYYVNTLCFMKSEKPWSQKVGLGN